jgi:flavin reductase (DIM6/NTAB) family NADH-FMN oxidoreductase RutF
MSVPQVSFAPAPDRTLDLRRAFGHFGTGVTVVTAMTETGPVGMTANSFSSISLDPPLVLWAPAVRSKRHDAFTGAAHFCVHVLGVDQLCMAEHFAMQGGDFDRFDWLSSTRGSPRLGGCLSVFHCDTHAVHPAGDHSLILGRVREVELVETSDVPGLLFDKGRFGQFTAIDDDRQ